MPHNQMLMSSAKLMKMIANEKMMTPIGPDISAPGLVILYQHRKSQRMATVRQRPQGRRQEVAKRLLLEIRGHRKQRRQ